MVRVLNLFCVALMGLSILGLVALVYSIIAGPAHGSLSGESFLTFGIAIVALTLFAS